MRQSALLMSAALLLGACREGFSPSAPTSESAPEFAVRARSGEPIAGRYIVVFRGDVVGTESVARALASKHQGKLRHTYKAALRGMAIELPDSAVAALRRDPAVAYVEQDQVVRATGEGVVQPGATEGLDRIDQRFLPLSGTYSYSTDGSGVRVYILDTGIYYGHSDFDGRAALGFDEYGEDGSDCHGHGTHVAGTVGGTTYGVAKKVQLYSIRVLDCSGSGTLSGVIAGVDWVTANHRPPAVANMSLGGGFSRALNEAVTRSIAAGVTYALAAGNSADDACAYSPSSTPAALTVAASDVGDGFAWFSNTGSCVDITAPGVDITSAWIGAPDAIGTISGTSMASPHVAGAAALYLSANTGGTPDQVATALTSSATTGVLSSVPAGTGNLLLYTGSTPEESWTARAALPASRRGHAVAAANRLLYAIGGVNSAGTVLTRVQAYDPSSNTWSTRASLPAARRTGNGAATINGTIYLAGGHDAAGALTRTLYAYTASTDSWRTLAEMPVVSSCGGSAVLSGKLYVFSGCTRSSGAGQVPAGLLHRYDPGTNRWTTLRSAPAKHFQPVVGGTGGKLYVAGGNNGAGAASNRLDVYDPVTNTWATRAAMPTARVAVAGAMVGGKLHVVGGRNGTTYLNTVEVYDPITDAWTGLPALPTARAALGAGVISNLLYAVGGSTSTGLLASNDRFGPQ